jgi:hypothetical protein
MKADDLLVGPLLELLLGVCIPEILLLLEVLVLAEVLDIF